jgi:biotin-dependent carboxylase-like uncharacterized protein
VTVLVATAPGPAATLQDRGRQGYQRIGVTPAGAMDWTALAAANLLVGNPPGTAAVELSLLGGDWTVEGGGARVAVAGSGFPVTLAGRPVPALTSVTLQPGEKLRIGAAAAGVRGYLAVAGGIAVPATLGSLATHTRSAIGGLEGRVLRPGDRLPLHREEAPDGPEQQLPADLLTRPDAPLRVVLGPQDDYFTAAGIATLLEQPFTVTSDADRMGYRLQGPRIEHAGDFNIISDGIGIGSIQVPGTGQPIVLLADRQSTGGYPKIACVITADLPRLAQKRPGDSLRFTRVDLPAARQAALDLAATVAGWADRLMPVAQGWDASSDRLLGLNLIDGVVDGVG